MATDRRALTTSRCPHIDRLTTSGCPQIDRLTTRETELSAALAAQASDYQKLIELGAQLRGVQEEKARLEERWLTVAGQAAG